MQDKIQELEQKLKKIMYPTKELAHGEDTLEWLLKIDPQAEWQIKIAALAHDIERAVPDIPDMTPPKHIRAEQESYDTYKQHHAKRSAIIVKHIMSVFGFEQSDIDRISNAIEKHEVGGDADSDLVRDADSIRWFDLGHENYIDKYGLDGAKEKGWWMYKRATEKTKKLIDSLKYNQEVREFIKSKLNS